MWKVTDYNTTSRRWVKWLLYVLTQLRMRDLDTLRTVSIELKLF